VNCRFAIGRAREIEGPMKLRRDPGESRWRESYCRWVCEARNYQCGDLRRYLSLGELCGASYSCS
jgi:hypothetical protein